MSRRKAERTALQESLATAEKQIRLGQAMQARGLAILNTLQTASPDLPGLAAALNSATAAIEKGASLESRARATILMLRRIEPDS